LTLVSNPIIWISDPKFWILQVRQSLLSTKKRLWSVIPFSTHLTNFINLIKVYQYQQEEKEVNITEERGTPPPPHPIMERRVLDGSDRWRSASFRLFSSLIILVSVTQVLELFQRLPVSDGLSPMPPAGAGGMTYCIPSFSGQKYGFSGPWSDLFLVWVYLPCFVFPESRIG
jgi:hypothetical protein